MPNQMQAHTENVQKLLPTRTFVDAHVHIHSCFSVTDFLDAAARNFSSVTSGLETARASRYVLCLTETYGTDNFAELVSRADDRKSEASAWTFRVDTEDESLVASHSQYDDMTIVAGRQIVTAERLEILALGLAQSPPDGQPISDVVRMVNEANAIPVLPWGFGKWLGKRRHVVCELIEEFRDGSLYLGDNSGRPGMLPAPSEFAAANDSGMKILPGTDPLPFSSEFDRAGSFGFYVDDLDDRGGLWTGLRDYLQRGDAILHQYGTLESPFRFIRNQIAMQYVTRIATRRKAS